MELPKSRNFNSPNLELVKDLTYYKSLGTFDKYQIEEIRKGLEQNLEIEIYAKAELHYNQMHSIRKDLERELSRLTQMYNKYIRDFGNESTINTRDMFGNVIKYPIRNNHSSQSKELCELMIDKIGRHKFRCYENITNYLCDLTNFNSDRFYEMVAKTDSSLILEDMELDIVEYVLEGKDLDSYLDYYFSRDFKTTPINIIIETLLGAIKKGGFGECAKYFPNSDEFEISHNEDYFYEFDRVVTRLKLNYVFCKREHTFKKSDIFEVVLLVKEGSVLENSCFGIAHVFESTSALRIKLSEDGITTNLDKGIRSRQPISDSTGPLLWRLDDFKKFDDSNIYNFLIPVTYDSDEEED